MGEGALAHATPLSDALLPVVVGQGRLSIHDVVEVATRGAPAVLAESARDRMQQSRAIIEAIQARGDPLYGLTTGVGALRTVAVGGAEQERFNHQMIRSHAVGHGPLAPESFVRAAVLVRAEGLAMGAAGVRPRLVDALLAALNANAIHHVHLIGSIGQSDLAPLAEIGLAVIGEGEDGGRMRRAGILPLRLGPREGLALISSNAFSVGIAALALHRASTALSALTLSAALAFEGFLANVSALDPAIAVLRPHPGIKQTVHAVRDLLAGGTLLGGVRPPRNLQDPLCFRVVPQTSGAALQALTHARHLIETELRSSTDNPAVLIEEGRAISNGNHDITPAAIGLDYARLGLAQAATIANERIQKLLDARFSALPGGLRVRADLEEDGLGVLGHGAAALTAEIRLLAAPVTLELPTTGLAEGIEDRISLAPVAARRLDEMAAYATRLAAIELICAAQAIDLRQMTGELGHGTGAAYAAVRARQAFVDVNQAPDHDLDPLVHWLEEACADA